MNKIASYAMITLWYLLIANTTFAYERQDSLRGGNGRGRNWWDVQRYDLNVELDSAAQSIKGSVTITFKITGIPTDSMQIDLQGPMVLDEAIFAVNNVPFSQEGNVYWILNPYRKWDTAAVYTLILQYHGAPRKAKNPPWDGGFIWGKDSTGKPWVAVACQGLGASSWWPCKDYQGDEPDSGMVISVSGNNMITNGSNSTVHKINDANGQQLKWYHTVKNPINNYNVTFYYGDYVTWTDTLMGEKGELKLTFCALRYNEAKARKQFAVVKQMLHGFEYWMGPYPFYEDGYKLVEAPYLGMEHQSAIAYGNEYKMGYKGSDRSGTGVGMLFDYIIIHESGHEWFGNNITAIDIADNWLHEGFTTYSETLFAEWAFGKEKAFTFQKGERKNILNNKPIIGDYCVNEDGSGDRYDKGSTIVHMLRLQIGDDEKFRQLLRGLNKTFYHKTVTSAEIEAYILKFTELNLAPFFQQYLRTTMIPELEWYVKDKQLHYRFNNVVTGFILPIAVKSGKKEAVIKPTSEWQSIAWKNAYNLDVSDDYLIYVK